MLSTSTQNWFSDLVRSVEPGPVNTSAFHLVHLWGKEDVSDQHRLLGSKNNLILHKLVMPVVYFDSG